MAMTRFFTMQLVAALAMVFGALGLLLGSLWALPLLLLIPLLLLGVFDIVQREHAVLYNYPIIGHIRFLLESIRPEIRQYFIEAERDPVPFSLEQRALVYRRAKNVNDAQPFGSIVDMQAPGYGWLSHSIQPTVITDHDFRITIGGPDCTQPYRASVLNISGTSFGALSANAIMALNRGAHLANCAHNTGEGSISPHHRIHGGDLIWQIATGYFGCRTPEGHFDPEKFRKQACDPQVKMIEIKLSQGAKPGHGGVLPKAKLTQEIAETRGVPMDRDCISPARHSAFGTPLELTQFIARLRSLAAGKPIGLKMAIGHRHEFMAIVKAMLETGITPDFIVIDGSEGGTGAAPAELSNNVGMPLTDALVFARNTLAGAGLKDRIMLGCSGRIVSAFDMARVFALGADYVMVARGFMFSLGCIQARSCHTNACPSGVATQDQRRQQAINVIDKAQRVANFHGNSMRALGELLGAAGLQQPGELTPRHLHIRNASGAVETGLERYPPIPDNALVAQQTVPEPYGDAWACAQASRFAG